MSSRGRGGWPGGAYPGGAPWPNVANMAAGRTGSIRLSEVAVTPQAPTSGTQVVSAEFDIPTPCVLSVAALWTDGVDSSALAVAAIDLQAGNLGVPTEGPPPSGEMQEGLANGLLRITYGVGAFRQTFVCDLRNGSIQLPPCHEVRVEVLNWIPQELSPYVPNLQVVMAISPGWFPAAAPPTVTQTFFLTANDPVLLEAPALAREVDVWAVDTYDTTAVVSLQFYFRRQGQPILVRDYNTGIWKPPYPVRGLFAGRFFELEADDDLSAVVHWTLEL